MSWGGLGCSNRRGGSYGIVAICLFSRYGLDLTKAWTSFLFDVGFVMVVFCWFSWCDWFVVYCLSMLVVRWWRRCDWRIPLILSCQEFNGTTWLLMQETGRLNKLGRFRGRRHGHFANLGLSLYSESGFLYVDCCSLSVSLTRYLATCRRQKKQEEEYTTPLPPLSSSQPKSRSSLFFLRNTLP